MADPCRDLGELHHVPEHVLDLLVELAYGWSPAPMALGAVDSISYRGKDISELACVVESMPGRFVATLGGELFRSRLSDLMPFEEGLIEGELESGARFVASMILHVSHGTHASPQIGFQDAMRMEAARWLVTAGDEPQLWVGHILGARRLRFSGNLIIERLHADWPRLGSRQHFRLSGAYTYYLVQRGSSDEPCWYLVVDTRAGCPDSAALARDFLLLQFVFGRNLRMPELIGVDHKLRTVATMSGAGSGGALNRSARPPVPLERNNTEWVDESWVAVLFDRISTALAEQPNLRLALDIALTGYLDAMTNYLDADYLRLHVALEAFSYWITSSSQTDKPSSVTDKRKWKNWVKGRSSEIRGFAKPGSEESFYQKVILAHRLPAGRVVEAAFGRHGLVVLPEMDRELDGRNVVVHQGTMAPDGHDAARDVRRVALVRAMLVGLIARVAGYAGAINGWQVGPTGYLVEPSDWWQVADADRLLAERTFVAEAPHDS